MPTKNTCNTCIHWHEARDYQERLIRECRRYPAYITRVPLDWCGEHSPLPVEVEEPKPKPKRKTAAKKKSR